MKGASDKRQLRDLGSERITVELCDIIFGTDTKVVVENSVGVAKQKLG